MKRRSMLRLTGGAALGTALPAIAQTRRLPRLGFLGNMPLSDPGSAADWKAIHANLKELGWEEGRNLIIERRFAVDDFSKFPGHAKELVAAGVDVIFAPSNDRLAAAYAATKSIPIVTAALGIVELGYAKSLAHPGGNVTGFELQSLEFAGKYFDLLYSIRPGLKRFGLCGPHAAPSMKAYTKAMQGAANTQGVSVVPLPNLLTMADIEPLLAAAKREGVQAIALVGGRNFLWGPGLQRIQAWAIENKVLASSATRIPRGEMLLAAGPTFEELGRVSWRAVDRILRGAKPADIPIEQPTRFEIWISRKIASVMGITIPQSVLVQATEVID